MFEGQTLLNDHALTARSAIWLTCPECDHTARVLAVMAGRVLRERRQCPNCHSAHPPHMSQTVVGAHIPASEAHHAPASDGETAYLRAWIKRDENWKQTQSLSSVLFHRLAARFSRTIPAYAETRTGPSLIEPGLELGTAKDKLA
jgi:hypothetical protein